MATIKTILREVDNSVKWLQGYDEMHFEIGVNANTLAVTARRLKGSTPPTPTPPNPPEDSNDMADITDKQKLQQMC